MSTSWALVCHDCKAVFEDFVHECGGAARMGVTHDETAPAAEFTAGFVKRHSGHRVVVVWDGDADLLTDEQGYRGVTYDEARW